MQVEYAENANFLLQFMAAFADQVPTNYELKDSLIKSQLYHISPAVLQPVALQWSYP